MHSDILTKIMPLISKGIKGNALSFLSSSIAHVALGVYDPSAVQIKF